MNIIYAIVYFWTFKLDNWNDHLAELTLGNFEIK